jgi:hypothetical protein
MSLDPKSDFKKFHSPHADTLLEESQKPWFKTAVIYALADLANRGATDQEINGANRFIEILNGLAADEVKLTRLPVKSLTFLDGDGKPADKKKEA